MQGIKGTTGKTICDLCGKEINRYPGRIKFCKNHYCSNKCRWQDGHSEERNRKISKARQGMKFSAETRQKLSKAQKERFKDPTNHPSYGKHRSIETRRKLSKAMIRRLQAGERTYPGNAKPGRYKSIYMRSQSEIKVAQWLDRVGIAWQYEVQIPLGIHNYLPDFYLPQYGIFWEVKGYFREEARQKMTRVRALYPESKFVIIDEAMLRFLGIKP